MNSSPLKCKRVLRICLREPFLCEFHALIVLFCYVLPELGMFVSITPTPKPVSLLFGGLYALVFTGICLILPKTAGRIFFAVSNFAVIAWANGAKCLLFSGRAKALLFRV